MKKLVFLFLAGISGCSTSKLEKAAPDNAAIEDTITRSYAVSKDKLWNATIDALWDFTIVVANKDAGILATPYEGVRYNEEFMKRFLQSEAGQRKIASLQEGPDVFRSRIRFLINETGPDKSTLKITKDMYKLDESVGLYRTFASDGIEENLLMTLIDMKLAAREEGTP